MYGATRSAETRDRLKEAMKAKNLRQVDLARITGISTGMINRYVNGSFEPKQNAIHKLAVALDVSEFWLWGYDVPRDRSTAQKKNDDIAALVARIRRDDDLLSTVLDLAALSTEKREAVRHMICALKEG